MYLWIVNLGHSYLTLGYGSTDPIFQSLKKIIKMIFLTCVVYYSENFLSDHKGFSIYNESGSKHEWKLPWLKHFND